MAKDIPLYLQNLNEGAIFSNGTLIFFTLYSGCQQRKGGIIMGFVLGGIGMFTVLVLVYLSWVLLKGDA